MPGCGASGIRGLTLLFNMILMKTKRLIFLLLSLILTVGVSGVAYGAAAPKKSSTSQTSSKKKNKAEKAEEIISGETAAETEEEPASENKE